jgi:hypothetical protein
MSELRDEPPQSLEDPREILLQQLSYYRASLLAELDGLSEDQLSTSISPVGLVATRATQALQEYARHVGRLDVVRELMDGSVGE